MLHLLGQIPLCAVVKVNVKKQKGEELMDGWVCCLGPWLWIALVDGDCDQQLKL